MRAATDFNGNVLMVGQFRGALDLGLPGGPLVANYGSGFVAKVDESGTALWGSLLHLAESYPDLLPSGFTSAIGADGAGNIYVAHGRIGDEAIGCGIPAQQWNYETDIIKLSADGSCVWAYAIPSQLASDDLFAVSESGRLAVVGRVANGGMLTLMDADGNVLWTTSVDAKAKNIAFEGSGDITLLGTFDGMLNLGSGLLPSAGGQDVWIARYRAVGGSLACQSRLGGPDDDDAGMSIDPLGNLLMWSYPRYGSEVRLFKYPPPP